MTSPHPHDAYVDGSALLAIAFDEDAGPDIAQRLYSYSTLYSSLLLDAEMRAAHARERREFDPGLLSRIEWVYPDRPLGPEIDEVLRVRYLRSGDLLHVATALYHARNSGAAPAFITLDNDQREVAASLGFAT